MRGVRIVAVLAVLFSGIMVVGASAQTERATAPQETTIDWRSCGNRAPYPGFDCAQVHVPLDYDAPHRQQITLQVARLAAGNPDAKIGSIFLNPGGPGGSGRDFLFAAGPFLFSEEVREHFDLIGFDPRGIQLSTPLICFETFEDSLLSFPPFPFPLDGVQQAIEKAATEYLAANCDANGGSIIDHMSTADVARDMDLMREMIGEETFNYAGYSYGSFLGAVYANLFPDRVRALIVDGVLDPVEWTTGVGNAAETYPFSTRLGSDIGAQDTLDEFFRLCDAAGPPACAFAPDSSDRFDALAETLLDAPIEITDPFTGDVFPFTYADLIGSSLGPLYNSVSWPEQAEFLAFIEASASPAVLGAAFAATIEAAGLATLRLPAYPNFAEGFPGVACSDSVNPDNYEAWPAAAAVAAEDSYFGELWTHASVPCWNWPGFDEDGYLGPFTADTANTVLVASTTYDPATPYHGALSLRNMLPNSSLVTVEGWGHTTLFLSACADALYSAYFLTGIAPADGTVCTQDFTPFTFAPTAAAEDASAADTLVRREVRRSVMDEVALRPGR